MWNFDQWILGGFEKFSHWTQRWFGFDNFYWAKLSNLIVALIVLLAVYLSYFESIEIKNRDALLFFQGLILIATIISYFKTVNCEKNVSTSETGFENSLKIDKEYFLERVLCALAIFFISAANWERYLIGKSITLGICLVFEAMFNMFWNYFTYCSPLPPSESKMKRLLKKGIRKATEAFYPAPVPAPISGYVIGMWIKNK